MEKFAHICDLKAHKVPIELPATAKGTDSKIGDYTCSCNSSLTHFKKPVNVLHFGPNTDMNQDSLASPDHGSPRTPHEDVVDPFAPGLDDMVLTPLYRKHADQMRTGVARCLNFDLSLQNVHCITPDVDVESISDEEIFESIYDNLLEAIVFKQTEGLLGEYSNDECDSGGCRTPPYPPHLNGTAKTCPDAPVKCAMKSRNVYLGPCKKLEF